MGESGQRSLEPALQGEAILRSLWGTGNGEKGRGYWRALIWVSPAPSSCKPPSLMRTLGFKEVASLAPKLDSPMRGGAVVQSQGCISISSGASPAQHCGWGVREGRRQALARPSSRHPGERSASGCLLSLSFPACPKGITVHLTLPKQALHLSQLLPGKASWETRAASRSLSYPGSW